MKTAILRKVIIARNWANTEKGERVITKTLTSMLLTLILVLFLFVFGCINANAQSYTIQGTSIVSTTKPKAKTEKEDTSIETKYTHTTPKDGKTYKVYLSKNGRAFINRISAKGNKYKFYIKDKDVCLRLCKEYGIEYKEIETR